MEFQRIYNDSQPTCQYSKLSRLLNKRPTLTRFNLQKYLSSGIFIVANIYVSIQLIY